MNEEIENLEPIETPNNVADSFIKEFEETADHTEIGNGINNEPVQEIPVENTVQPGTTQPGTKKKSLSTLIKPKFVVNIIDILIPTLLVFIISRTAGYSIEKSKLNLDKDEKEMLTPFVDEWLEAVQFRADNPHINLLIGICLVYGIRTIDVIPAFSKISSDFKEVSETNTVLFEREYNKQIERIQREKKKKTLLSARKYFAEQETNLLNELIDKFEIEEDLAEKYLNPTNKNENEFTL